MTHHGIKRSVPRSEVTESVSLDGALARLRHPVFAVMGAIGPAARHYLALVPDDPAPARSSG